MKFFSYTHFVFGAAFFVGLCAPLSAAAAPQAVALEVSGWIPYWKTASGTADALAHLDAFTEINPFGYIVKTDGTLHDAAGLTKEPWVSLIAAAKAKGVRVVPTVMWSDTNAIHKILSNQKSRIALEDEITRTIFRGNFDGVDIDFEGKKASDKDYFSTFLKGLYARMGNKWVMCTIEARTPPADRYDRTPPPEATIYANDYVAINKYCDRVRLMTYDQGTIDVKLSRAQKDPYIPVADPQWVERVVTLAAQSISKRKLQIGIATYGYEYEVTPLREQGYRYDVQWAFNPAYAQQLAEQYHRTPERNRAGELSFLYMATASTTDAANLTASIDRALATTTFASSTSDGNLMKAARVNIVWWSDAEAIADKIALAKKLGVRGISIFKIDGGEDPRMWSKLPAVR